MHYSHYTHAHTRSAPHKVRRCLWRLLLALPADILSEPYATYRGRRRGRGNGRVRRREGGQGVTVQRAPGSCKQVAVSGDRQNITVLGRTE
ncbi:hypothetical protein BD413DRAFT_164976 [Trametes elegans]|nr:hypothetical protein BD413DRAFT_164976 [Trametes elegans]